MADNIKFYKTIMGEWFAVERVGNTDKIYYSCDSKNFLRLHIVGSSSSNSVVTAYKVENPHEGFGWEGKFLFDGKNFILEREDSPHRPIFRPTEPPQSYEFLPLPHIVEVKGLGTMPDGKFLFWTGTRYDFAYKDVKFYFGEIDCLKEYVVLKADASTIITEAGTLSILSNGFDGYKLKVLEHKAFEVEIEGEKVRLERKKIKRR